MGGPEENGASMDWNDKSLQTGGVSQENHERRNSRIVTMARLAVLILILTIGILVLPERGGILWSLAPEPDAFTVSGMVRGAPGNVPLAGVAVYSDRELVLTDKDGHFRLACGRNAAVRIETAGYRQAWLQVKDPQPLMFLLFPEPAPDENTAPTTLTR